MALLLRRLPYNPMVALFKVSICLTEAITPVPQTKFAFFVVVVGSSAATLGKRNHSPAESNPRSKSGAFVVAPFVKIEYHSYLCHHRLLETIVRFARVKPAALHTPQDLVEGRNGVASPGSRIQMI